MLSAARKADLYVLVCQLCCLSFLALCSTTESDCLAAMPLLCCLCFQRKEDGWNFIQPEHCSHARLVFINDASLCHKVRCPNQWLAYWLGVWLFTHTPICCMKRKNKQTKKALRLINMCAYQSAKDRVAGSSGTSSAFLFGRQHHILWQEISFYICA